MSEEQSGIKIEKFSGDKADWMIWSEMYKSCAVAKELIEVFKMDPEEQLKVFLEMENHNWQLLAIYHSHLQGPQGPSATDIAEAYFPEAVNLLWSNTTGDWNCLGYSIREGKVAQVEVVRLPAA